MREIMEGLKTLHDHDIIRRELSPKTILVGNTVLLTDFELGKLFDSEPTVGKNLAPSPYRAPEVGKQPLVKGDEHVDLYSWGRILLKASTGSLPNETKKATESFDEAPLPPRVREIGKRCLLPAEAGRPKTADEVLKAIRGWK
jgi:serine/threonine protein kinase